MVGRSLQMEDLETVSIYSLRNGYIYCHMHKNYSVFVYKNGFQTNSEKKQSIPVSIDSMLLLKIQHCLLNL